MEPVPGSWSWMEETSTWRRWRRRPKTTTSIALEKVQGNLLPKQNQHKHQHPRLFQRLHYHTTSAIGLTSNQVRSTKVALKCQKRWSDCFDTILSFRNYVFSVSVNSNMAELFAQRREDLKRDSSFVWIHSMLIASYALEQFFKATREKTHQSYIARQRVGCRTISPSTSTIPRYALNHPIWIDSGKGSMRCSLRPWFQCSSAITVGRITKWHVHQNTEIGVIWGLQSNAVIRDHPSQHSTCDVYRQSGNQKVRRRIVQQNVSISYCTAKSCTEAGLALWTPGHCKLWRENVLRPFWQAHRALQEDLQQKSAFNPFCEKSKNMNYHGRRHGITERQRI